MSEKPKGRPRGKPFTGADDPRRSNTGQRSAEVVAFNSQLREIICQVGNEIPEGEKKSQIELAVRGLYKSARIGNVQAFSALVERVEGKVPSGDEVKVAEAVDNAIENLLTELKKNLSESAWREIELLLGIESNPEAEAGEASENQSEGD